MGEISIHDIARITGVSIATVSRIINENGRYSEATKQKVLKAIEENNYIPNRTAQSLRTKKSKSIGLIVTNIENEFFAKIVRAIELKLMPMGYTVLICDTHENEEIENLHSKNLISKNVDGVIYISGKLDVGDKNITKNIPTVYIDRKPDNAMITIRSDNENGGYIATKELTEKNCQKILLLQDYPKLSTQKMRKAGYEKALLEANIPFDDSMVIEGVTNVEQAKKAVIKIIETNENFDGVFATNDLLAIGALEALLEKKIKVPEQVKIVGFDDIYMTRICKVPITTITQDSNQLGILAAEHIINQINQNNSVSKDIVLPVKLTRRKTT